MPMYDVSVIIINYNTTAYTLKCVDSVISHTSNAISYQIIVVDNNSTLESYNSLKEKFPTASNIILTRSNINTGFGGGNMHGNQFATGKYILFLNNDAYFLNDCLSILYTYMEKHPKVGVCTAQNYNNENQFVPSFDHNKSFTRLLLGRSFLEKQNPKNFPKRKKEYTEPLEVNWVNGAFLFFKKKVFSEAGGFDTNIFLYFEEMDICHRLLKLKYKSTLVPEAKINHYQGASIGSSKQINKEGYISYLYVIKKNYGYRYFLVIKYYLLLVLSLKPKKWYLLSTIANGGALTKSLKQKQQIRYIHD